MLRDYSRIDTTPGAVGENAMFSPPAGFDGDTKAYWAWLKGNEQELRFMAHSFTGPHRCLTLTVVGPYAEAFQKAFRKVCDQRERDIAAFKRANTK
ncbi:MULTISPECIES: hypothetical protein [unclassified Rhodanobacter]|uniref:hypothetical protein n=1 Tax=unclassified Rhodanobacter TaxID=2621553 RepID=UPI0007AA2010|nr:hypothetical protein [Rhodanobacter sp. FW510-R10]KZC32555.1 hypothetical protein RhoFW510R10_11605 [Rhodanobacter sp. FW510-R10]